MKVAANKIYLPLFVLILLVQLYLPSFKACILMQLAALGGIFIFGNVKLSGNFLDMLKPFLFLLLLGFVATIFNSYAFYNISKDIFHFIKPITGLLLGYVIFRQVNNEKLFVKSIVVAGILSSLIHLFIVFVIIGFSTAIEEIRLFTRDNFLDLFALFFLIYYKKFFKADMFKIKLIWWLALALIIISVILYFSRTMIILAFLLVVAIHGLTRITPVTVKLFAVFVVSLALLFTYLSNANIRRDAKGLEGFLYKVKIAPEEMFKTRINREDHRDLWDHWRGYEANRAYMLMEEKPYSFVIGTGHGSLVNLKFNAPLTGESKGMRYISELHNGYMYIFYKTGIIGIMVYLSIMFWWYSYIYRKQTFINIIISAIGLFYLISSLTITGIYNSRDIIIMILGAALFFAESNLKKTNNIEPIQTT
ncbi:O-antigen ligase family protein [Flavobacterium psychrotrophum]|uniref:O-antigen ligase family protein n=1 Tax=Flavobacterium psychrotrophum TaxID=2294119 RepID=UPI000E31B373|nr:O-antigen ligase family protein [Flavobacterium psychrotrophum]